MILRALLSSSDRRIAETIQSILDEADVDVLFTETDSESGLWRNLKVEPFDLLLVDQALFEGRSPELVRQVQALPDSPEVIVLVGSSGPEGRAELVAAGALAVVGADLERELLAEALGTLVRQRHERAVQKFQLEQAEDKRGRLSDFASGSPAMRKFLKTARRVVDADSSLLILGETGVGKEYLATAIHEESHRSSGPFVALNCAAIAESLLESELFGHAEGAFTGAGRAHRGYFEAASGGTIFLDEIGELPLHLQVKILRVLQDRKIQPVGSERVIAIDVRVVAATNKNLKLEIEEKRFRSDLYYRLGVVSLTVPPLRERREDIPALVESHIEHFQRSLGRPVFGIRADALDLLMRYRWPGNVRELINVVERAVLLSTEDEVTPFDLPEEIKTLGAAPAHPSSTPGGAVVSTDRPYRQVRDEVLELFDRNYFDALLRECGGRVGDAATRAGITSRALYDKMKRLGLRKEAYKVELAPSRPAL